MTSVQGAEFTAAEVGRNTIGLGLDVRAEESWQEFLDAAESAHGPLDMVINNAGVDWMGAAHEEPLEVTRRQIEVNLLGAIIGSRAALNRMLPRGFGKIVNVASAAARSPQPGSAVYTATKYGVLGYTETLRLEYRDSPIEFAVVLPGQVATAMMDGTARTSRVLPQITPDQAAEAIVDGLVANRFEVWAPRSQGPSVKLNSMLPRRVREKIIIALGVHNIAGNADMSERQSYIERAFGDSASQ